MAKASVYIDGENSSVRFERGTDPLPLVEDHGIDNDLRNCVRAVNGPDKKAEDFHTRLQTGASGFGRGR